MFVTEDDCSGQSNSEKREILMELSTLIMERPGLTRKASRTSELLWEKPFQDQDLLASIPGESLGFLRMTYRKNIT